MSSLRGILLCLGVWGCLGLSVGVPAAAGEPIVGGRVAIGIANLLTLGLNHAISSGGSHMALGTKLFASPLRFDKTGTPQPYLARRWHMSEDGRSVTLALARNAVFHDGVPITSRDVRFSISVIQRYHPFRTMLDAVQRVDTPDDHTAVIRLRHPVAALPTMMTPPFMPIIPEHIYGDGRDITNHPANWRPVGSGPFQFVAIRSRSRDEIEIDLERNDRFFLPGRPYLDGLTFVAHTHNSRLAIPLEFGELHIGSFGDELDFSIIEPVEHLVVSTDGNAAIGPLVWVAFNLRRPPWDDVRVRRAIAHAIDRRIVHEVITKRRGAIATGPIAPGSPFYSDDVEHYDVDVDRANGLLDQAGLVRNADGERFATTISFLPSGGGYLFREIATYLARDLGRKLGIRVRVINTQSFERWARHVANWDFDLTIDFVFNWGDPMIGVHRTYDSTNIRKGVIWSNTQGYENPAVDAIMHAATRALDFQERKRLYLELQRRIMADVPVYPLIMLPFPIVHHRALRGIGGSFWGLASPMDDVYWADDASWLP